MSEWTRSAGEVGEEVSGDVGVAEIMKWDPQYLDPQSGCSRSHLSRQCDLEYERRIK